MPLEAPPFGSGAAEAGLDFICDVQAAGGVYFFDDRAQEPCRAREDTVGGEDAIGDEGRQSDAVPVKIGNGGTHLVAQVVLQGLLVSRSTAGRRGRR